MTTYRLWPATNGGSLVSYSGNWIGGVVFGVKGGGNWFQGFYQWVPSGGDTSPVKCALWSASITAAGHCGGTSYVVPGTVVTSGTLTANAWNYIPITTPVQLAPSWDTHAANNGSAYIAAIGWTAVHGFPDTNNYWGSGQTAPGITNGPLRAYMGTVGASGSTSPPYQFGQGVFSTGGTDPSVTMPVTISNTDNFWIDVQISDTAPAGYAGTYRLWPNKCDANQISTGDAAVNYTVATEIHLTQPCTLNNLWYFSPGNATTLATRCDVWNISTGLSAASITSPAWKDRTGTAYTAGGATNGAWIKAAFAANTTLPAGSYRVSVYNSSGSTDANWSPKDAGTDYFGQTLTGVGSGGITAGPLYAPDYPNASGGYVFGGAGSNTPPWSSGGTTQAHAQPVFYQPSGSPTGAVGFPQLYAVVNTDQSQNYWVDLEVTSTTFSAAASLTVTASVTATALNARPAGATRSITASRTAAAKVTRSRTASRAITAAITAVAGAIRHRSAEVTTTAAITAGASKSGLDNTTGARPIFTATITATATAVRHRTASRLTTAARTAAALVTRHRSAARPVTATITATATTPGGNRTASVQVSAHIAATAVNTTPHPQATPQGSWWQLRDVLVEQAAYADYYRSQPPMACPNDGEPLTPGPGNEPVVWFCKFDGWSYPEDYDPDIHSGM